MSWARRFRIDSRDKLVRILNAIGSMTSLTDEAIRRRPLEVILREEKVEMIPPQRSLFHAICGDIAPHLGMTPGEFKDAVKAEYFGADWRSFSTEELTYEEYSMLIETAYRLAAWNEVVLPDRRKR